MKIGILGGTFNPVHLGHIALAKEVKDKLGLDRVIFVPAYIPPHKLDDKDIISSQDRYRMVELAIKDNPDFELSDIEIRRAGTSYSIDTIKKFRDIYGERAEIFFITGSDSISELDRWKDIELIKKECALVIVKRPGYTVGRLLPGTMVMDLGTPDISSTEIRSHIRDGRRFKEFVPREVRDYIIKKKLYL